MLLFGACCACGPDWDFWRLSSRDWASGSCFDCGCWLASLALLALLSHGNGLVCDGLSHLRTRLVYPFCARGSSIPLGHEARLSRLVTRLVYPTWARGSSIPPGHEAHRIIPLGHAWAICSAIPLGHGLVYPAWARDSSIPLGHELVYPTWARARLSRLGMMLSIPLGHGLVCPAWARGSSIPPGHEARLSCLACGSTKPRGLRLIQSLCWRLIRAEKPMPCPLLSGARLAGIRPAPASSRPKPCG